VFVRTTPVLLKVVRSGKLHPSKLVTHRFAMNDVSLLRVPRFLRMPKTSAPRLLPLSAYSRFTQMTSYRRCMDRHKKKGVSRLTALSQVCRRSHNCSLLLITASRLPELAHWPLVTMVFFGAAVQSSWKKTFVTSHSRHLLSPHSLLGAVT
jgi:hypothetical protein